MRINAKHDCPLALFQNKKSIELVRLYVLKEFHGTGVANDLMDFAIDFARRKDFNVMYLSVWEYNFRARGFYEKHGFLNSGIENDFPLGSTPQTDYWFVKEL
jgi:GNAT superfamily N-acetyltransferase